MHYLKSEQFLTNIEFDFSKRAQKNIGNEYKR